MIHRKSVHSDYGTAAGTADIGLSAEASIGRNSKPVSGHLCDRCQLMIREGDCIPLATIRFFAKSS